MSGFKLTRRRFLGAAAAGASSLVLAGCDQFDFLGQRDNQVRDVLESANSLTYQVQRRLVGDTVLAREFAAKRNPAGAARQRLDRSDDGRNICSSRAAISPITG